MGVQRVDVTAGGAYAHLTVADLQDYVTDNMRGILKSEEEWNVLDRKKSNKQDLLPMSNAIFKPIRLDYKGDSKDARL